MLLQNIVLYLPQEIEFLITMLNFSIKSFEYQLYEVDTTFFQEPTFVLGHIWEYTADRLICSRNFCLFRTLASN